MQEGAKPRVQHHRHRQYQHRLPDARELIGPDEYHMPPAHGKEATSMRDTLTRKPLRDHLVDG
jgi:hypothetical protein